MRARGARLARILWFATAIVLAVVAVLLTMTRLLLPLAENYRGDLARWASQALGHPVEVGSMSARWHRWGPELALFDVRMSDTATGPALLRFDEVHIGVDLIDAVREWRLQPSTIRVIGTHLVLVRRSDGRIQLQGLGETARGSGGNRAAGVAWLFSRQHLLLEKADLEFVDPRRDPQRLRLSDVNLELRNDGNHHQLAGKLQLPASIGHSLTLGLDARDVIAAPDAWRARIHLKVEGVQLATLTTRLSKQVPPVKAGSADLELWGKLQAGRVDSLVARVGIAGLAIGAEGAPGYRVDKASGDLAVTRQHGGWSLRGAGLRVTRAGNAWPAGGFTLAYREPGTVRGAALDARWDYLRVDDLVAAFIALPSLPQRWREVAAKLAPRGAVTAAHLQAWLGERPHFVLAASLKEIGFQPWRKVPGIQGLSGRVVADERSGHAEIGSANLQLDAPEYFRAPFSAHSVTAALEWARVGKGWGVVVHRMAVNDPVGKGRGVMEVEWQPERGAFLDLRATLNDGDGSDISPYVPTGRLPATTVVWLDRGLAGGKVPHGDLLYRGRIKAFPFPEQEGRFATKFEVRQGVLEYQPGWPRIEGIDAAVEFDEASMRLRARHGVCLGAHFGETDAQIPDFKHDPVLSVKGRVEVPLGSGLNFLRQSPLTEGFGDGLKALKASGESTLDLALSVPLHQGSHPRVAGTLDLKGGRLQGSGVPMSLEKLEGRLRFSEALLQSEGLKGEFMGAATHFSIHAPLGRFRANQPAGRVSARGRLSATALARWLPHSAVGKRLSGRASWNATLQLPRRRGQASTLKVNSDLQGVTIDMPRPLGKRAADKSALSVEVELARSKRHDVAVRYADRVDARLRFRSGTGLERGEVRFGGARARMPGETGLTIAGDIKQLSVPEWRAAFGGWGKSWDLSAGLLKRLVVRIGTLFAARHRIDDVRLAVAKGDGYWAGSVNGKGAKGYLRVPFRPGNAPVLLRFDRLRLARDPSAEPTKRDVWPDPRRIPPVDVTVAALQLNDVAIGKLTLRTLPEKAGMRITRFMVQGETLQVDASGQWQGNARSSRSAIDINLQSADTGQLLKALAYAEGIKNGRTVAEAHLTWPGPPGDPDLQGLTGRVSLTIHNGRLVNIEPGAGRIFGLLSFQALPRRLILDFRDFFLKGFSFDEIKGDFRINSGDAYSDNLRIEGPAARIDIVGRTGLARRDYDQLVTVIPNVTAGLPIAGWAAGGPAVGAVMLFFQKMFGKKIDENSGFRYHVTGPWDNPKLEKLAPPKTSPAQKTR